MGAYESGNTLKVLYGFACPTEGQVPNQAWFDTFKPLSLIIKDYRLRFNSVCGTITLKIDQILDLFHNQIAS